MLGNMNSVCGKKATAYGIIILFVLLVTIIGIGVVTTQFYKKAGKIPPTVACQNKLIEYCSRWATMGMDPGDWDEIQPKDCEKYGVQRPQSEQDCQRVCPECF